ncbi:hypothetical protein LLEC1_05020 [Akanthomyces lecanii]|uniref:Transketolase-like pyrimidine-binding domain-containing protein n=1 Tax=Cordyceps confragosa TaxID=2714763 RepID=A0A179IBD8_CORDF|nr:hypothetical protein LLEC1_05020 [Akanthomyces lecanii]
MSLGAVSEQSHGADVVATFEKYDRPKVSLVLNQFRCLIADLCQQFNGGHPGSAMGMAAIGIALWKYVMKYSPKKPNYFNRDRLVLSNGHTRLFQYTFLHLVGYKDVTFGQLKPYHSARYDSFCPGHPEIEIEGIEVTTGAKASPTLSLVNNTTWCMIGDACLQEGVALEAFQAAGHWKLNNLVVVYDNNQITCDGSVDMCNTEDVNAKMRACGWDVLEVADGCFDVEGIVKALLKTKDSRDRPTFINIRTVIGIGSAKAHGAAYGSAEVRSIKQAFGMNPDEQFVIHDQVYSFFADMRSRGDALVEAWTSLLEGYRRHHPQIRAWTGNSQMTPKASRHSAGMICNPLAANLNHFIVGTADLSPSVAMIWKDKVDFQHPGLKTECGINGTSGRYIHYGVREHAMAAIANGIAAFNKGTFLPVTSTFFMFYIYAAPAVRMGALQGLQAIHIARHDSIGTGEDGPTHQPIELAQLYRAMPNILYIRPCDTEETAGAFIAALGAKDTPTILSLSRQKLPQYLEHSDRGGVQRGAYVFIEEPEADVTFGVGAEMCFAVRTCTVLRGRFGVTARVVSFPCQRLFDAQPLEYKRHGLKYCSHAPRVVIEAYAVNGWERYADAGFSMSSFGKSLPGQDAYRYFGFDGTVIAPEVAKLVDDVRRDGIESPRGEFRDLNPIKRHY